LIVLGLAQIDRTYQPRVYRSLALLGAASYAIYLVHAPVMSLGIKFFTLANRHVPLPPLAVLCALFVVGTAAGIVLHLWIEQPLLQLFRTWSSRPKTAIGTRTAAEPATSMLPAGNEFALAEASGQVPAGSRRSQSTGAI
jgi:peptidoglycan/LPS O-acetylase OafA/YrhL